MPDFIQAVIVNALANLLAAALYEALKAATRKSREKRDQSQGKHFKRR